MILVNETQDKILSRKIRAARNFFQRLRGLIGTKKLAPCEGLLIPKCQGIHTFGMAFPIDVVFLDRNDKVVKISRDIGMNRTGPVCFEAYSVLEFISGSMNQLGLQVGDQLRFLPREG